MSAEELLSLLEQRDLIPSEMLAKLREKLSHAGKPVTASRVAKLLIEKGYLTPVLAMRLLDTGGNAPPGASPPAPPPEKPKRPAESGLGLVPLDDEASWNPAKRKRSGQAAASPPPAAASTATVAPPHAAAPLAPPPPPALRREEELFVDLKPASAGAGAPAGVTGEMDKLISGGAVLTAAGTSLETAARPKGFWEFFRRKGKVKRKEDWGSPLILVGSGVLLILILMAVGLIWRVVSQGGDELLEKAKQDYEAGKYAQAIFDYNEFLEKYSSHPDASLARVKRGLAQLRQVTQPDSDWQASLKTADDVLTAIRKEDEFKEAYSELAGMLPLIAEGLAARARETADPALLKKTRQALSYLTNPNYVPAQMTPTAKIQDLEASLALTEKKIRKNEDQKATVEAIRKAVAAKKPAEAFARRKKFLKQYPELIDDPQLTKAAALITEAQKGEVRFVAKPRKADRSPLPAGEGAKTPVLGSTALISCQTLKPAPGAEDAVRVLTVEGTAFGLEAATGKVRWRIALGDGENALARGSLPLALDPAGKDVVVVDSSHQALLRIEVSTGKVGWRFSVGEPFEAAPVLAGGRILQATPGGKLWIIDAATGDAAGYFQLPQPLRVAPAVDALRGLIFQPADYANLYVLRLDERTCASVYLLGHEEGCLRIPPAFASGFLVVGFNEGAQDSTLRLLAVAAENPEKITLKTLQPISLKGRLDTPPSGTETRLLTVTDLGLVKVFELTQTEKTTQLRQVAETPLPNEGSWMRFALLQNGQAWIADSQLARYNIQLTKGELKSKWITQRGSAFLQPPQVVGSALISVRRVQQAPGIFASAVDKNDDPTPYWQTQLAAPLAGLFAEASGNNLLAVTAAGGLYRFDSQALRGETLRDDPLVQINLDQLPGPVLRAIPLENGLLVLSFKSEDKQLVLLDPRETPARIYRRNLPSALTGEPVAFAGGVLAPLASGQVALLDPQTGEPKREPFQPALAAGGTIRWQRAAPCGPQEFVIADNQRRLYLVGLKDQPSPHLGLMQQADLLGQAASHLAVVGQTVFLACSNQTLGAFMLPKLSPVDRKAEELHLTAPCVWGPYAMGDRVLLATENGRLSCWDAAAKRLWEVEFKHGLPVGPPLADGSRTVLAAQNGVVAVLDANNGKETSAIDLGRPLSTGPAASGSQWLVGGADGCVYAVGKK
jgi:outer membrane protein assembly factor BamB